jgi:predicted component of type VI protein secretion system
MLIEGVLAVEDLSSNGTWLNGTLLKAQMTAPVKSGDVIEIPGYHMQVMVQSVDAPQNKQARIVAPPIESPAAPRPAWTRPLVAALSFFEPVEAVLILLATATFALISFYLNR